MHKDLTKGDPLRLLVEMALPIIGSSALMFTYNFVDMLWVGRLGSDAVVAVGTSGFFLHLGWALVSSLLVGGNIRFSQAKGAKSDKEAKQIASNAWFGLMLTTLIYFLFVQVFTGDIIGFFELNNSNAEQLSVSYLRLASFGLFFQQVTRQFTGFSNGAGDSKTPFRITLFGVILNMVLDPILIFALDMGVLGAALATVCAQVSTATAFWLKRSSLYLGRSSEWNLSPQRIVSVMRIGLAPSVQYIVFSVVAIVMGRIVSSFGSDAIAAQKIGLQIEAIALMAAGGLNGAVLAYTGQNFGANQRKRIVLGFQKGILLAASLGLIASFLFYNFAEQMVCWFVKEPETIAIGTSYLKIIGLSQLFQACDMFVSGIINGMGKTKIPASINITMILLRIPLALYLSQEHLFGIDGIWYTILLSTIFRGLLVTSSFFYLKHKVLYKR